MHIQNLNQKNIYARIKYFKMILKSGGNVEKNVKIIKCKGDIFDSKTTT